MECGIYDFIGLSGRGLSKDAFSFELKKEDISFMDLNSPAKGKNKIPYFKANIESIKEYYSIKDIRRLDKYARMFLLICAGLLKNIKEEEKENTAVVLGTSYGSFKTNCDFLDSIIFQGFEYASPMLFTGTVHNSPLAPLGMFKGIKGPSYSISNFEKTFESALYVSRILLSKEMCPKVLLVFVDEISPLLLYGFSDILNIDENDLGTIPQEGGCGFLLEKGEGIIGLEKIWDFIKEKRKYSKNYGFTFYPEAFDLLIYLNSFYS